MAFNSTVLTVLKTIVWLSLMSNFVIVLSDAIKTEESDIYCLKSIKDSLEDPYDYLGSSWNFGNSSKNRAMGIRLPDRGLKGQFPRGISNCTSLQTIDLSGNKLVGIIPYDIWRFLPYVVSLDLSANSFSGEIPPSIASLRYLNILKLDDNRLTGQIPHELGLLPRINSFSVANNLLSGPVPDFGSTSVTTAESYANNKGLCGGPFVKITDVLLLIDVDVDLFCILQVLYIEEKMVVECVIVEVISKLEKLVTRISFTELVNTTDNFKEDNIIGLGKTGIMYKAVFPNGSILAIKRFFNSQRSKRLFMSEVMTLGRLRHTNLVPLIGFCYETMEKLLVYKYMPNGNLYDWLHPPASELKIMKWPVRVKIAVGLARGLAWLHHYNRKLQVFHQNISSKCVLLDKNFEPKISNFGKAKFMSPNDTGLGGISVMIDQLLDLGFKKKDGEKPLTLLQILIVHLFVCMMQLIML
ncbi:hypothetical protein CsSME_00033675 [Camellia sinensis var. sinensis]